MKIECICASTNHDDFLENVIPLNKIHFDEYKFIELIKKENCIKRIQFAMQQL